MNIQQHQTLRGLLRKLSRQYPKAYRALQQALLLSTVYVMTMTLIPGSQLPFQKAVKMQQLNMYPFLHAEPASFQSYGFTTCSRPLGETT